MGGVKQPPDAHVRRAANILRAVPVLLRERQPEGTISACYSGVLHLALALPSAAGLAATTHRGSHQLFSLHSVKNGPLSPAVARGLARLLSDRDTADYDATVPLDDEAARETVALALRTAGPMLALIRERAPEAMDAVAEAEAVLSEISRS